MKKFILETSILLLQFKLQYLESEYHKTDKEIQELQKQLEGELDNEKNTKY